MTKVIKDTLTNTHENLDDLYAQYYDSEMSYRAEKVLFVINNKLTKFEQDCFYLYAEYCSFRKVAEETNVTHQTIKNTIDLIKQKVEETTDEEFKQYRKKYE